MLCPIGQSNEKPPLQALAKWWEYVTPISDGTKGIMFANRMTPDGWFVREDGSWDEKR